MRTLAQARPTVRTLRGLLRWASTAGISLTRGPDGVLLLRAGGVGDMTYAPAMTLTVGWARLARAGVFGGASLFLATAGHMVGGGTLPGAGLLALTAIGLALLSVTLTARRVRFGVLLAALGVEQVLLHLLFHASTTAATCAAVAMPGHTMVHGRRRAGAVRPQRRDGWPMLLGHAARGAGHGLAAGSRRALAVGEWPTGSTAYAGASTEPGSPAPTRRRRRSRGVPRSPPAGCSPVPAPRRSPDPTSSRPAPSGSPPCRCHRAPVPVRPRASSDLCDKGPPMNHHPPLRPPAPVASTSARPGRTRHRRPRPAAGRPRRRPTSGSPPTTPPAAGSAP